MKGFELELHVDAPPDTVFRLATDIPNAAGRIRGIARIEMLTAGPVRVGTRFRETRVMFKREATEEMQVTAFEPPRRFSLEGQSCGCRYRTAFQFAPDGSGTRVKMHFQGEPLTFFAKAMSVVMRPMMKLCMKEMAKDLQDLKALAEGAAAGAAPALG